MSQYSPTEKVAIVMLALGEELASEIFRNMSRAEVQKVGAAMGRLGRIDQETVDIIMSEFRQIMDSQSIAGVRGSPEFLKNAISLAFKNTPESQELFSSINRANYRMRCVELADAPTLYRIIQQEHPQTVALILAHAPQQLSAALLRFFPESLRTELITRIARLEEASFEALHELDDHICKEIEHMGNHSKKIGGVAHAAAILNELQKDGESLLDGIDERDPELSEEIRSQMFRFEDLVYLDSQSLRVLYQSTDPKTWLLSLRGIKPNILQALAKIFSERAFTTLKEDIEALGPQKKNDVYEAQKEIILKALNLEQEGKIQLRPDREVV